MKIYLAGPFFNLEERKLIENLAQVLRSQKHDVFVPMEHFIEDGDMLPNHIWGQKVFQMDVNELNGSNIIIAVYHGHYSDTGVAWELGYAYGIGIPIVTCHVKREQVSSVMINNSSNLNVLYDDLLHERIILDEWCSMSSYDSVNWLTIQK